MTTFDQELTGRYVSAGADRPAAEDRRVARAAFVRDTIRTTYDADKEFGIDPAALRLRRRARRRAEGHLELISNNVGQRSVVTPPSSRGETA